MLIIGVPPSTPLRRLLDLRALIGEFPGDVPVVLALGDRRLILGPQHDVKPSTEFYEALERLVPREDT